VQFEEKEKLFYHQQHQGKSHGKLGEPVVASVLVRKVKPLHYESERYMKSYIVVFLGKNIMKMIEMNEEITYVAFTKMTSMESHSSGRNQTMDAG